MTKRQKLSSLLTFLVVVGLFVLSTATLAQTTDASRGENVCKYRDVVYPLERNGLQLYLACLSVEGTEPRGDVLLVHGLTYSSHVFDVDYADYSLARFLARHGFRVWRIDVAGYGRSERPDDGFVVTAEYAAQDVLAALTRIRELMDVKTVDLLGWSWGTITTGLVADRNPELIGKYVLYAPVLTGLGEYAIEDDYHRNAWEHAAEDFQKDESGAIRLDVVEQPVVDAFCSNCWRYDGEDSPNGGRREACCSEETLLLDFGRISSPTLVICGDKDPYMNLPLIRESFEKLPQGSKLVVISGASHVAMLEKPFYREFQERVLEFLTSDRRRDFNVQREE